MCAIWLVELEGKSDAGRTVHLVRQLLLPHAAGTMLLHLHSGLVFLQLEDFGKIGGALSMAYGAFDGFGSCSPLALVVIQCAVHLVWLRNSP